MGPNYLCGVKFTSPYACKGNRLGVQTDRILSDRIRIRIQKLDTDIRYPNIRADTDTDMVLNFNYPYPNSRYISYNLIYIMKKFMLFTIIIR